MLIPMLGEEVDGLPTMPFTKEQIKELKKGLKPVHSIDDFRRGCNILINPDVVKTFVFAGAKFDLCYSIEEGFYHLYYFDSPNELVINGLIENGDIHGAQECDIEIYFSDWRKDQSEHRLAHFPFYVYEQDRCINCPPERVVIPRHPMKVGQMPEQAKKYMFKLPVRFAEKAKLEPAEYIDSQCWLFNKIFRWAIGIFEVAVCLAIYFGGNALLSAIR